MAYADKRSITIDHTKCGASNSTDFPMLFNSTDPTFRSAANGGHIQNTDSGRPADFNFFSDSPLSTPVPYDCKFWDPVAGQIVALVKVNTDHVTNPIYYTGYNDPAVTTFQGNKTATYNSGFKGVYHLGTGTTLDPNDATSGANNGTFTGTTGVAGLNGGAANFATSGDKLKISSALITAHPFNFSATVTLDNTTFGLGDERVIMAICKTSALEEWWASWARLSGATPGIRNVAQGGGNFFDARYGPTADTSAHRISFDFINSSTMAAYFDGVLLTGSGNGSPPITPTGLTDTYIGAFNYNGASLYLSPGLTIEEAWFSNLNRGVDWYLTEANNQLSPSTFYTLGAETPVGGGSASKLPLLGIG